MSNPTNQAEFEQATGLVLHELINTPSRQLWNFFAETPQVHEVFDWHASSELRDRVSARLLEACGKDTFYRKCLGEDRQRYVQAYIQHWVCADFSVSFPALRAFVPSDYYNGAPLRDGHATQFRK